MEQTRKHLKISSIVVLILAGLSMFQLVCELWLGEINNATIPEGAPDNILLITKIFLFSFALLLMIPNIYIGIKGLRIAKNPNPSKGHIVWAIILLVLASLSLFDPVIEFVSNGFKYESISSFFSIAFDVVIFLDYIKSAMAVRKELL